jgi:hypothetical protein
MTKDVDEVAVLVEALNHMTPDGTHEGDITDVYEALEPFMSDVDFVRLGGMLELCPQHYCDIQICRDDGIHGYEAYGKKEES